MAWLESHQELGNHPKVAKLSRLLGCSRPAAVGHLHYFWWWAMDYARDGDVTRYDALQIVTGSLWDGDEALFMDAMVASGFIDRDGDRLIIHDWAEYGGKSITRMDQNAARQRAFRERRRHEESGSERNDSVTVTSPLRNALTKQNKTDTTTPDVVVVERARKPDPKPRPHRLPDDWYPGDGEDDWARRAGFDHGFVIAETEKFRDHFRATGKTMTDWSAAWRNWIRRSADFAPKVTPLRANGRGRDVGLTDDELYRIATGGDR